MAVEIAATVCKCHFCFHNRVKLQKHLNRLKLFPASRHYEAIAVDVLGPLPRTWPGKHFLLVITDPFTKQTKVIALAKITACIVAVAFCEVWVFKNGYRYLYFWAMIHSLRPNLFSLFVERSEL